MVTSFADVPKSFIKVRRASGVWKFVLKRISHASALRRATVDLAPNAAARMRLSTRTRKGNPVVVPPNGSATSMKSCESGACVR